ncbi:MAG: hypothetical protein H6707_14540 [Deltaproteobacteria bacterium]|nr:hypothetical protein [Deltaproteobacteria bacterium]
MLRTTLFALLLTLSAWGAPALAEASVLQRLDLDQLTRAAETIAVGRVLRTESRWTKDGRRIITDATFRVDQAIAGCQLGDTLTVRRLGGKVNGLAQRVFGAAVLTSGDEVLLFLRHHQGWYSAVGMSQGAFFITRVKGGLPTTTRDLSGLALTEPAGGTTTAGTTAAPAKIQTNNQAKTETLTALLVRIKRMRSACLAEGRCR